MEDPKYIDTPRVGGIQSSYFIEAFPRQGLQADQSFILECTFTDEQNPTQPFDISGATATIYITAYKISNYEKVMLGSGVLSDSGSGTIDRVTFTVSKDLIPDDLATIAQGRRGNAVITFILEDADTKLQFSQIVNISDEDFILTGDNSASSNVILAGGNDLGNVIDFTISTPPVAPNFGDAYLVGPSGTGDWSGEDNNLTVFNGTSWVFRTALEGNFAFDENSGVQISFNGTSWSAAAGSGDMTKVVYDPQTIEDDAFDRTNMTGTQTASTISDFDTEVANNSAVVLNTDKTSNATHTGDVTGSEALTLESVAITGQTSATPVSGDKFLFSDTSDSGNLKECDFDDIGGGGGGSGDVVGPASATDDRIATFDGITGKLIKDGGNTIPEIANATHTGEVTGATSLTVNPTAITNKTEVTADSGDFILISDTSDSGNLKKVDADDFLSGGGFPSGRVTGLATTGVVDIDWSSGGTFVIGSMTGDITLTFSDISQGQNIIIEITGAGGFDITLPSSASSGWAATEFIIDEVNYLSITSLDGSTEQAYIYSTTNPTIGNYISEETAPTAPISGARLYVDSVDGDLKVIFSNSTIVTLASN